MQLEEFLAAFAQVHRHQPGVAADAMLLVYHRVADVYLGQVAQHALGTGARPALVGAPSRLLDLGGVKLVFADDGQLLIGQDEAALHRRKGDGQLFGLVGMRAEIGDRCGDQAILGQKLGHRLAPAHAFGGEQNAAIEGVEKGAEPGQRIGGASIHFNCRQWHGAGEYSRAVDLFEAFDAAEQFVHRQENIAGRQQRVILVAAHQVIARLGIEPELLGTCTDIAMDKNPCRRRQVIEHRRRRVEKQWQVILNAVWRHPARDILVHAALERVALEAVAEIFPKPVLTLLVQRELACRQHADLVDRVDAALGIDVKGADGVDFIAEQVDAIGYRAAGGKQVDQSAANRVFARRHHLCCQRVARQRQVIAQPDQVQPRLGLQEKRTAGQVLARAQPRHGRGHRHDADIELPL